MSGHSKWSTIKHQKSAQDQKRGALFSKLAREISAAVAEGKSGDPTQNPRLRAVLDKTRAANMPRDNIARAIDRGLGKGSGGALEEVVYEGYGPAGIAVVVVARTDNRQRTTAIVKHHFEQVGGNLGVPGSAIFLFERSGENFLPKVKLPVHGEDTKEKLMTFIRSLSSDADVSRVFCNADLTHE